MPAKRPLRFASPFRSPSLAASSYKVVDWICKADEAHALVAEIESLGGRAAMLQLDVGRSEGFADFATQVTEVPSSHFDREHFDVRDNSEVNSYVAGNTALGRGVGRDVSVKTKAVVRALAPRHACICSRFSGARKLQEPARAPRHTPSDKRRCTAGKTATHRCPAGTLATG